ncbi:DUF5787 family protein [Halapricum hydrolyticum]|uniref:DUF5787 family protein n=1 Tax=Halapricum hydrolyticum TaxID=2979991 RepID=A0AAE3LHC9_9EURY|nr:DUF5787 family protein [Halapricum hydrolyticum]MCU4717662.1 DUF5787 family protein [Halapricum hydrolyticum]MCU4726809.1 DUF5787 family protein [Halapricum hydrolyticum]
MREYGFELALCATLETDQRVLGRQLGASVHGRRIVDTVVLEPGPEFEKRAAITDRTIPDRAIEADVGVGRARDWRSVFPDLRPERARSLVERGVDIGFFERERRDGRLRVRQTARYPDQWFDRLVGIENKPDLDRPGDLQRQLRQDVALGLFDEVVLATGSYVTGAHLNRIPEAVGVWRFDPEAGDREVIREPEALDPAADGTEIVAEHPGRTEIRLVDAEGKRRARRRLAERAYGKGWRPTELPACANCEPTGGPRAATVPFCAFHDRIVEPAVECGPECPGHEPAEPPAFDRERERSVSSAWQRDPSGYKRRQAGLDRFG